MYVYELIEEDGTPFYVGQSKLSTNYTANRHYREATNPNNKNYNLPRCAHIRALLDRKETFGLRIVSEHKTREETDQAERARIEELGIENLTNLVTGGIVGFSIPPDVRQKISKTLKGRVFSEEHRRKLSESHAHRDPSTYNRTFSPEHRRKLGLAASKRKRGEDGRFQ